MKTQTNSLKKFILKTFLVVGLLLMLQVSKSLAQTIYARVEMENVNYTPSPWVAWTEAEFYIRFYSDFECTTPTTLTDNITFNWNSDSDYGPSSYPYTSDGYTNDSEIFIPGYLPLLEQYYSDEERHFLIIEVSHSYYLTSDNNSGNTYVAMPTVILP